MSAFVLDCSIAASWLFEDEATPETDALLQRLETDEGLVPGLWRLELGNVLTQAERRKRIVPAQIATFLSMWNDCRSSSTRTIGRWSRY